MNGYNRKSPQKRRYDMPKYAGKSYAAQSWLFIPFDRSKQHFYTKTLQMCVTHITYSCY